MIGWVTYLCTFFILEWIFMIRIFELFPDTPNLVCVVMTSAADRHLQTHPFS